MKHIPQIGILTVLFLTGLDAGDSVADPASPPQEFQAICLLEVDGERYIDGECTVKRAGAVGSETLGSLQLEDEDSYVQINYTSRNEAYLHWSGTTGAKWTRSDLGKLKSNGLTCFLNDTVKACMWPIPKLGKGSTVTDVSCFAQGKLCKRP